MQNKTDKVYEKLLLHIKEGVWKEGQKIYSERKLSELYQVSRVTVRTVISKLIEQKILEHKLNHSGTYVKKNIFFSVTDTPRFICVAIDNKTPAFATLLLEGIHKSLSKTGIQIVYCNTFFDTDFSVRQIKQNLKQGALGLIFAPFMGKNSNIYNSEIIELTKKQNIPLVQVDRFVTSEYGSWIGADNKNGMKTLTHTLIERGGKRFLIICGYKTSSSLERLEGIIEALEESNRVSYSKILIDEEQYTKNNEIIIEHGNLTGHYDVILGLNKTLLRAGKNFKPYFGSTVQFASVSSSQSEAENDCAMILPICSIGEEAGKRMIDYLENSSCPDVYIKVRTSIVF